MAETFKQYFYNPMKIFHKILVLGYILKTFYTSKSQTSFVVNSHSCPKMQAATNIYGKNIDCGDPGKYAAFGKILSFIAKLWKGTEAYHSDDFGNFEQPLILLFWEHTKTVAQFNKNEKLWHSSFLKPLGLRAMSQICAFCPKQLRGG